MNRLVVVTGIPASGKSGLGAALAAALGVERLDKDTLLEGLFDTRGTGDLAHRRSLSRQADEALKAAAMASACAVVVSWWRHPRSGMDSGTQPWWLQDQEARVCEVHCQCDPDVAAARFLARRRHPGHLDERWSAERLLAMLKSQAALGPLGPRALAVNTGLALQPSQVEALARQVSAAIGAARTT